MKRIFRPRLIALIAATTALATLIPAGFAIGFHDDGGTIDFGNGVLQLHMVDGDSDEFRYGGITQPITESRCEVSVAAEDLITFEGTSDRGPGIFDHGLGVKSGGAQGVACSRVSDAEELQISLLQGDNLPLDGLEVAEAHLDIEVKQSAEVIIKTYLGEQELEMFTLRSGRSIIEGEGTDSPSELDQAIVVSSSEEPITNCRQRSDSGPDAGAADNCRWVLEDITPFDSFVMTAGAGEFTLEGGNDGTVPAINGYGSDTLFFLGAFLDCGETVSTGDGVTTPIGTFTRVNYFTGEKCIPKNYTLSSSVHEDGFNRIDFAPSAGVTARYTADLTSVPYAAENPVTQTLTYDPDLDGTYQRMQWCLTDPGTGWAAVDNSTTVLPTGESWCITASDTELLGDGTIQTTWTAIGEDDPGFRFG